MPHPDDRSLWSSSSAAGHLADRALWGAEASVTLGELVRGSSLGGRLEELRGRSVLIATSDQLTAALALVELDGVVRRLVLGPPDLPSEHLKADRAGQERAVGRRHRARRAPRPPSVDRWWRSGRNGRAAPRADPRGSSPGPARPA